MKQFKTRCTFFAFSAVAVALLAGTAVAQPDVRPLPVPATAPDLERDAQIFEEVVGRIRRTANNNPQQATAEWQQLLEARPNMAPAVGYKVYYFLAKLQADELGDRDAAIATQDAGLKKYPNFPEALGLIGEKGRVLIAMERYAEAEAALRPYWRRALDFYTQTKSQAVTMSRLYLRYYAQALEHQRKQDEIAEQFRTALLETPALLTADSRGQGEGWIYELLVKHLLAKKQNAEALSLAKLRFVCAGYEWGDTNDAVQMLARVWRSIEGPDSPSLRAFVNAQVDPTRPNPLAAIPLPELTDKQRARLMAHNAYMVDKVNARILAGQPGDALAVAYGAAMLNPTYAGMLGWVCQALKADDLNTERANRFIQYLENGIGPNPLEASLRASGMYPEPVPGAATEEVDLKAVAQLKTSLAEKGADANVQFNEYHKFLMYRPLHQPGVGIRVSETKAQLLAQQLKSVSEAQAMYRERWKKYIMHPDALLLIVAERKLSGTDIVPDILQLQRLVKLPAGDETGAKGVGIGW